MSNNTNELTAKEIFAQITLLQKQLTDENAIPLFHLSDAVTAIARTEEDADATVGTEQQITDVCSVFKARETTLLKLLEMYERMYADIQIAKKIELIKNIRLSTLQDMKEFYSEDELLERADSVMYDISTLCNDIYLTKN